MDDNKLDDFLRNKLLKYPSPVPGDMWQRIQQKKDRKRFIWFWLMLLSPLFVAGVFFIFHKKNDIINNTSASYNVQNTDSLKTSFVVPIHPKTNNGEIYKKDSISTNQTGNKKTNQADSKGIAQKENISKAETNTKGTDKSEVIDTSRRNTRNAIQKNSNYINRPNNNKPIHQIEKEENTKTLVLANKEAKIKESLPANNNREFQKSNKIDPSTNNEIVSLDKVVKPMDTSSSRVNKFSLPKDSSVKKKEIPLVSKEKKGKVKTHNARRWFLEIYGSPDISFFERNSGNPFYYGNIKSKKNSYTVGVRAGRYFGKHLSLKAGLQYSRITEKFFLISDSNYLVDRYASLDVPLLVGYDLKTPFIKTTINAGIVYNLYTWYQGMDMISNIYIGRITEIYKHNTGASVFIGLNLSKQINKKLEIMAEPYYRYRLSYMTMSETFFSQKINIAGVNVGLRYNFRERK